MYIHGELSEFQLFHINDTKSKIKYIGKLNIQVNRVYYLKNH